MEILALDPGTVTGAAWEGGSIRIDLAPVKASVKKNREAEPEYSRCGKIVQALGKLTETWRPEIVVVEGAAAFQRGKAAVRVSHELRGAVKAWCWTNKVRYEEVQPGDLKRFITGRTDSDKATMVAEAKRLYGYIGDDDNVADAMHLLAWGKKFLHNGQSGGPQNDFGRARIVNSGRGVSTVE